MLIQVTFTTDGQAYTYNAPSTVKIGDRVLVPVDRSYPRSGEGRAPGKVIGFGYVDPAYGGPIKSIIEVIPNTTDVVVTVDPRRLREHATTLALWQPQAEPARAFRREVAKLLDDMIAQAEHNLGSDRV